MTKHTIQEVKDINPDGWNQLIETLTNEKSSRSLTFGAWLRAEGPPKETFWGCNAWMGQDKVNSKNTLAIGFHGIKTEGEVQQHFLEWILSKDSVFAKLFEELGEDCYTTLRNEHGKITGWVTTNLDVNSKIFVNFFKSMRTLTEHVERLTFWEKYAIKAKYNPKIVYLMMYAVSPKGDRNSTNHAPIEQDSLVGGIDLQKFSAPHKLWTNPWDLGTSLYSDEGDYVKENKTTWGGTFKVYKDIIKTKVKTVPTRFYYKYFEKPTNRVDISDLEQFMSDVTDGSVVKKYERFLA